MERGVNSQVQGRGAEAAAKDIEAFEQQLAAHLLSVNKLKAKLAKGRGELAKGRPVAKLNALAVDLRAAEAPPPLPPLDELAARLERHARALGETYGDSFRDEVRRLCESQKVPFRVLGETVGVGPFALLVDVPRETAALQYAKVAVARDLALDPATVVRAAQDFIARLLQPVDASTVAAQVEEAMRVALARHRKATARAELRVELPLVFKEMCFIRQTPARDEGRGPGSASASGGGYTLPRFVVELKTLMQSDENVRGERRFRLEPAVLENSKDPKKSIFLPNDPSVGYGEGTYYQAIVLPAPQ